MRKWGVVVILCVSIFCQAKDSKTSDNVSFVIDFLAKIHSEKTFTIQDEQKFLGTKGGLLGLYLHNRLLSSNKLQTSQESKCPVSLIGTLLQLKKEFLLDKSAVVYIGEMNDMLIKQRGGFSLQRLYGMMYVVVIGFTRKDIMSLDNKADICIFAIYKKNGIPRIDLSHTIINGMRAPAVLGFVDDNNEYDIKLNSEDMEILLNTLKKQEQIP